MHDTRDIDIARDELDHIAQNAPHLPRRVRSTALTHDSQSSLDAAFMRRFCSFVSARNARSAAASSGTEPRWLSSRFRLATTSFNAEALLQALEVFQALALPVGEQRLEEFYEIAKLLARLADIVIGRTRSRCASPSTRRASAS